MFNQKTILMKREYSIPLAVGLIIAFAGTVLMLILLAIDYVGPGSVKNDNLMYGGTILFIFLYIFLLVGLYVVLLKIKKLNQDSLTFLQAIRSGMYTSLSTALFSVIFTIVFYEFIYPDYGLEMAKVVSDKLESASAGPEEVAEKIAEQTKYYSTGVQAQFSFVGNLITGMAFSVLLGLFLKTRKGDVMTK